MEINIITENNFIIKPDTDFSSKKGRIFRDNLLARCKQADDVLEKIYSFKLFPGITNPKSVNNACRALIKAPYYSLKTAKLNENKNPVYNRYDLSGFGILCAITPDRKVYPVLRKSHGAEKWITVPEDLRADFKENIDTIRQSYTNYWPIIEKI